MCGRQTQAGRRTIRASRFGLWLSLICVAGSIALLAAPAAAEVTGSCTAEIAGQDVGVRSSSRVSDAIEIPWDATVTAAASAQVPLTGYRVEMEFAGFRWEVAQGETSGDSWSTSVEASDYAPYGVGVYKVIAHSDGTEPCAAAALIKLTGKNPLTTVAGVVGAVLLLAGGAGTVSNAFSRRGIGSMRGSLAIDPTTFEVGTATWITDAASYARTVEAVASDGSTSAIAALGDPATREHLRRATKRPARLFIMRTLWIVLLAPAMMAAGSLGGGPGWTGYFPRIPSRPRVSIAGLIAGAIAGLGALVLLQQFGVVYPTRVTAILLLVAGAGINLILGTAVRARRVSRLNAMLARAEQRLDSREGVAASEAAVAEEEPIAAVWSATHAVPPEGMQAWAEPDPSAPPAATLEAGSRVALRERRGGWALVESSDGWSGWVDARLLLEGDR